jgi:hypothetical protein
LRIFIATLCGRAAGRGYHAAAGLHLAAFAAGAGEDDALLRDGAGGVDALGALGVDDDGQLYAGLDLLAGLDARAQDDGARGLVGLLDPHGDLGHGQHLAEALDGLDGDDGGIDGQAFALGFGLTPALVEVDRGGGCGGEEEDGPDGDLHG